MSETAVGAAEEQLDRHMDLEELYISAIALEQLVESGHNARRRFDPARLEELAASIREKGIIEPLIVRPFMLQGEARYEIVAGARRYRASKLAGRTHVPCVARDYTDEDVLELQIVENIQRDDLDPLDEAAGYAALIESNKSRYSVAYIADRIGRTEKYVWDRLRLLGLVPEAKQHLEHGRITVGHAVALARLTPERQKAIIDVEDGGLFERSPAGLPLDENAKPGKYDGVKAVSVKELEHYISDHVRFDPKHLAVTDPLQFGDTAKRIEEAEAKPGRGKKVIAITHDHFVKPEAKDENERTYGPSSWKRADGQHGSKSCEWSVLGVVAAGAEEYGQAFEVCIARDKCEVHWKKEQRDKARTQELKNKGQDDRAAKREQKLQQEREAAERRENEARQAFTVARPLIMAALAEALKKAKPRQIADLVINGCDRSYQRQFIKNAEKVGMPRRTTDQVLRFAALVVLFESLTEYHAHQTFPKIAKKYGVDIGKILNSKKSEEKEE